jgi:hypothetical protein
VETLFPSQRKKKNTSAHNLPSILGMIKPRTVSSSTDYVIQRTAKGSNINVDYIGIEFKPKCAADENPKSPTNKGSRSLFDPFFHIFLSSGCRKKDQTTMACMFYK